MVVRRSRVKTPTLLQMEAVECGAAALGIMLSFYGRIVPLAELRRACGVSRDGSKASNMVKAARLYGLDAKGFKKELNSLRDMSVPFIVFWQFNHFLVVEGWNRQTVFLNDPATGPRQVSWQEFDEGFTGVVLCMEPGEEFVRGGRKPSLWLALGRQLKRSVPAWLYVVFIGFLLVLPGLVIPVFSQIFVDQILIGNQQDWLRPLLLGLVMTTILQAILRGLQLGRLRDLKMKLMVAMNGQFLWHILRLPIRFYAQRFAGEISSRTALNTRVSDVIAGQLSSTVIDGGMLVFYGAVMLTYDWFLTLIGVGVAVLNLLVLQWVSRQRVDTNLRLNQDLGKLSGVEISGLQSIETLKATASESDFFSRWSGYYAKTINAQQELSLASQRIGLLPPFLSSITTMLILVLGGLRVIDGHLSIGMLVAFQSLMASFQGPVQTLVGFGQQLQTLESDLYRLDDVLNNPIDEGLSRHEDTDSVQLLPQLQGRLEFRNVTFGYSQVDAPLLENFNFVLEPGKRIALVGSSGSGKSTIAKLASGLYQPWAGEILLDDRPRLDYHPLTLVQSVAMVEQDIFLFGGTVSDNLSLWDPSVLSEDLIHACRDAEIHDVISAIPGGYSGTLLEAGADLSGGQRQRLEIARALVNHPSLLILDEATSALDAETEALIDQNLRQRGCACLIVAHRLSTIRDCDEIIVLHQGKVMEQGTHDELWANGGYYAALLKTEGETVASPDESVSGLTIPSSVSVSSDVWVDARRQRWTPHESISLSHESRLWCLKEGKVSIFACPSSLHPGTGRKRYLYTVKPSESFCSWMALEETDWTLEAIASESSELESLPLTVSLPQQWLASLSTAVPSLAQDYALDQAHLFYRDLSQGMAQLTTDERQQRTQQLIQKAQFNAEVTHDAFHSLASVLQSESIPDSSRGSELMQAMGAIAHVLKLPLQPIRLTDQGETDPVMAIAQASQFRVRRVSLTPNWWRSDAGPLLGYLADQTPVALLPRGAGRYDLYNSRTQRRHRLTSRLAQSLDPNAYSFYRPFPQGKNQIALFKFALSGQWSTLFTTFLVGIGVTLLGMLIPQATGMLIDYAIPNADQRTIIHMGLGLAVVAIASTLFRLLQNLATMRLEAMGDSATQAALWDHLLKLKLDFFRQFSTGDLQSRVSAIRQIRQLLSGTTLRTLISGLVASLNLILLFVYSPPLALVALGVTLLVVIATVVASLLIRGNILRQQQLSGELFGFIVQLINGIAKLRVAHAENRAFASWASRFTPLVRLSFFQQRVEDAIALFNTVIPSLANAVIFWLVVDLIQVDASSGVAPTFTAGTYLAFNAAFGLLLSGATSLSNTLVNVLDVWILWGRVKPILEAEPEITPHMSDPGNLTGAIQVQGCTFRYRRDGSPILDEIHLSIRAGEFVAIVGPSGSGKSTLLRLLLGFESPESGRILYDGQDLQGLDVTAVRRQLGVVLQNSKINAASLYENIAGNAKMTLEDAFQAASRAGMAEDIAAMPMGMHTLVNEGGGNLSGGQRQRLIIARALAQEPRLLFFDEATSALDNRTQDIVTRSLNGLKITRIIIAHRLSTVRMADRIFVLDRGKIIQSGSFDELSRSPGLFQTLMNRQRL